MKRKYGIVFGAAAIALLIVSTSVTPALETTQLTTNSTTTKIQSVDSQIITNYQAIIENCQAIIAGINTLNSMDPEMITAEDLICIINLEIAVMEDMGYTAEAEQMYQELQYASYPYPIICFLIYLLAAPFLFILTGLWLIIAFLDYHHLHELAEIFCQLSYVFLPIVSIGLELCLFLEDVFDCYPASSYTECSLCEDTITYQQQIYEVQQNIYQSISTLIKNKNQSEPFPI